MGEGVTWLTYTLDFAIVFGVDNFGVVEDIFRNVSYISRMMIPIDQCTDCLHIKLITIIISDQTLQIKDSPWLELHSYTLCQNLIFLTG